jgi:hypothetical protein
MIILIDTASVVLSRSEKNYVGVNAAINLRALQAWLVHQLMQLVHVWGS